MLTSTSSVSFIMETNCHGSSIFSLPKILCSLDAKTSLVNRSSKFVMPNSSPKFSTSSDSFIPPGPEMGARHI